MSKTDKRKPMDKKDYFERFSCFMPNKICPGKSGFVSLYQLLIVGLGF